MWVCVGARMCVCVYVCVYVRVCVHIKGSLIDPQTPQIILCLDTVAHCVMTWHCNVHLVLNHCSESWPVNRTGRKGESWQGSFHLSRENKDHPSRGKKQPFHLTSPLTNVLMVEMLQNGTKSGLCLRKEPAVCNAGLCICYYCIQPFVCITHIYVNYEIMKWGWVLTRRWAFTLEIIAVQGQTCGHCLPPYARATTLGTLSSLQL